MNLFKLTHAILFLILLSNTVFGTSQFGDILIYKNDTVSIFSNPLEAYFEKKGERTIHGHEMEGLCTALWRGYVATWEIKNDSLFLIRIQTDYCSDSPTDLDINKEFKSNKVFAHWFTGNIRSQLGEMLSYMHAGYGSVYEKEQFFQIKAGAITATTDTSYIEFTKGRLHPGLIFLKDTIQRIIYNYLDTTLLDSVKEDDSFELNVIFNSNGNIEMISGDSEDDSSILQSIIMETAKLSLKHFPLLMKVNHARYSPPIVRIWFDGHCLKHPDDIAYGCEDYRLLMDSTVEPIIEKKEESLELNRWIYLLIIMVVIIAGFVVFSIINKRK